MLVAEVDELHAQAAQTGALDTQRVTLEKMISDLLTSNEKLKRSLVKDEETEAKTIGTLRDLLGHYGASCSSSFNATSDP
ncbi:hypothetical protein GUJ93_ZPchr0009g2399 [Zizania palustris]|uniref:Uncharacterized protein n=1 Tax=Zizania palustris TaxID=103762 RepID=A0A8J5S708_ZIZPA|nr:hypothetical protein GUJ93_ZPchr0009g2399 [Zizania palustris]